MVKKGYKQTEIGEIPEDWEVKQLRAMLKQNPKYGINAAAVRLQGNLPVYIRITDISSDGYFNPENKVGVDSIFSEFYYLEKGDIVFARTGASVGKSYLYKPSDGRLVYAGFLIKISPNDNVLLSTYLFQYVKTKSYWDWVQVMSMRSGQPGINGNEYGQLYLPVPKIEEQKAIAEALSDVDGLIESQEDLLAKKRNIKTATMQQLLTGKTRLARFRDEWKLLSVAKHASLKARIGWQALTTNEYLDTGDYYLVTGTDFKDGRVNWHTCHFVDEWRYIQDKNIQLKNGDVLITKDGTIGKVGYVENMDRPATLNSGVFVIRSINNSFNPLFLFYILNSRIFDEFLSKITAGSTITHLYQKDFVNFEFLAPDTNEQTAIATILSDMDAEIEALEARLAKTKDIKQGMMQELLTGKTRLVSNKINEAAA